MATPVEQGASILLDALYRGSDFVPVDPTVPVLEILNPSGTVVATVTPTDGGPTGYRVYTYNVAAAAPLGLWTARWTGFVGAAAVSDVDYFEVVVAGGVDPNVDGWVDAADLPAGIDLAIRTEAAVMASWVLFELSGRRFGSRTLTVRPQNCMYEVCDCIESMTWSRPLAGPAIYGCCSSGTAEILLASPVQTIIWVKVDGVLVDPSDYEVLDDKVLMGVDGYRFPCGCGNGLEVRYRYGQAIPPHGITAAKVLATEIAAFLSDDDEAPCNLPQRVQSVMRQGVSIEMIDAQAFLDDGRTGIFLVDLFLRSSNPGKLQRQSRAFCAEFLPPRRVQ